MIAIPHPPVDPILVAVLSVVGGGFLFLTIGTLIYYIYSRIQDEKIYQNWLQ